MEELSREQFEIIFCRERLQVVMAGPGSGKTRTICAKIRALLLEQVPANQIIVVTFTNAAAAEIARRVDVAGAQLGYCGTIHGWMLRLINARDQQQAQYSVADEEHAENLLCKVIKDLRYKGTLEDAREMITKDLPERTRYSDTERVALSYRAELEECGLIDFDGILRLGLKAAKAWENPGNIQWLIVDESQDCSDIDFRIFEALAIPHKIFVGDPDQAIYNFRGGNVDNILKLAQVADAIFTLSRNYRSTCLICDHAQQLIEHNERRFVKQTIGYKMGGLSRVDKFGHPFEELASIATHIQVSKLDQSQECAVLFRTNDLARKAAEFFEKFGLKVAKKSTAPIPDDWLRARTALNLLCNPENDAIARLHLTLTLGEKQAETIHFDALGEYRSINQNYLKWPRNLELGDAVAFLISKGISSESMALIRDVRNKLHPYARTIDLALALGSELHHVEEVGEGITVTTMHSAKGREWSFVYLPAFEAGTCPMKPRKNLNTYELLLAIEEERRLAYVAITRAKHSLFVSYCTMRQGEFDKAPIPRQPSPFLKEAGLLK